MRGDQAQAAAARRRLARAQRLVRGAAREVAAVADGLDVDVVADLHVRDSADEALELVRDALVAGPVHVLITRNPTTAP